MKLTDQQIKAAKPADKQYKLLDGKGLNLIIHPNGSKYWRLRYLFLGKESMISLGTYPNVTLKQARDKCIEIKRQIETGINPAQKKKLDKLSQKVSHENSLEAIGREWLEDRRHDWTDKYANRVLRALEKDIFKPIGFRPISELTAQELLITIKEIEKRDVIDGAHRALQYCGQIFRYAVVSGRAERDITSDLKGGLKTLTHKHYNKLNEDELPLFLQKLSRYDTDNEGDLQTKLGLELIALTFVRTGELRGARWDELKLEKKEWHIPAERMKMREKHIVPLSKQSLAILEQMKPISGHRELIFPGRNKPRQPISENTLLYAMYRRGYRGRATPHGIRSTASTILNEHGFNGDHVEAQLAHAQRNKVRATYNHAKYLPERHKMMQWWADYLGAARTGETSGGGNVIEAKFGTIK